MGNVTSQVMFVIPSTRQIMLEKTATKSLLSIVV